MRAIKNGGVVSMSNDYKDKIVNLYGQNYAPNSSVVVESLFKKGGTCHGTYKKTKKGVFLYDLQGKERVYIRKDGVGPVSTTHVKGKRYFMFATTSTDEKWLCTPKSYLNECLGAQALADLFF
jgi:hypothetical protein